MANSLKSNTLFDKAVGITLALSPILQTYGWPRYDFAFLCIVGLYIWWIFRGLNKIGNMPSLLNAYLLYYLVAFGFGCLMTFHLEMPVGWLKIYLIFLLFFSCIKFDLFKRYYVYTSYITIIFLFIQIIAYKTVGLKIPGVTSVFPLSFDNYDDTGEYIKFIISSTARSCSFFSEPALCAQYLLPLLSITLFSNNIKLKFLRIVIISTALLMLQSGNAMYIMAVVFGCYIIYNIFTKWSIKRFFLNISIVITFIIGGIYYINSEAGQKLINRQNEIENTNVNSSGYYRIYRGYALFEAMSPLEKLLGINNKILMTRAAKNSSKSSLFSKDDYYFNTIQNVLIKTGFIGLMIFISLMLSLIINSSPPGKTIIIGFLALSFIASIYLSYIMLIFLIFAYKMSPNKATKDEKSCHINDTCRF